FPPTVELAVAATFLATLIGIPLGTLSAVRKDRLSDHVTRVVALTGYSMPLFWLALVLQIFAVKYAPWLPIQGEVTQGILSGRPWSASCSRASSAAWSSSRTCSSGTGLDGGPRSRSSAMTSPQSSRRH